MSPCLKVGIGTGYVPKEYATVGNILTIIVRDRALKAEVVKLPFL
jgi:aminomethyltransferase